MNPKVTVPRKSERRKPGEVGFSTEEGPEPRKKIDLSEAPYLCGWRFTAWLLSRLVDPDEIR